MEALPFEGRSLHVIGIGGAGMSGLALVAHALGARITGSDRADSPYCAPLRAAGIEPSIGHDAANLPAGAEVVLSTAIGDDNPEVAAARAAGARVMHRSELLHEITALRPTIAVAGTHGKTTTSSMIAHVLRATGRDPGFLIGGELRSAGTNAGWGAGEWSVVEADESDRSFLSLRRDVAIVTNVELDHHATYSTLGDLMQTFQEFLAPAKTRWTSEQGRDVLGEGSSVYGIADGPAGAGAVDLRAERLELLRGGSRFEVEGVPVELTVPGRHNVLNALAALAACREAGVGLAEAAPALPSFTGAGRRFERHGTSPGGAEVVDDYAHHPTEVRATLEAARTLEPARLIACFQPHLYSRTQMLAREFGQALALADVVVVLDVYPARERAEDFPGVSGMLIARAAADAGRGRPVWWLPAIDAAAQMLRGVLRDGDLLMTLGAGDVDRLARELAP